MDLSIRGHAFLKADRQSICQVAKMVWASRAMANRNGRACTCDRLMLLAGSDGPCALRCATGSRQILKPPRGFHLPSLRFSFLFAILIPRANQLKPTAN